MVKKANTIQGKIISDMLKEAMEKIGSNFKEPVTVTIGVRLWDEMIVASNDDLDFVSKYIKKLSKPKK